MLINSTSSDKRFIAYPQLPLTHSELAVPLLLGNQLIGVLDFQLQHINHFSPDDVRILTTLSEQTAVAVNNARLYQAQVEVTERLRKLDIWMN